MVNIKNVTMRNFLSIGNATQSLSFDKKELVLVLGENLDLGGADAGSRNGAGKSSMLNAVSYALFSWPISNIKKEHLVNTTNGKNMVVTIEFESNGKNYKIVRGLKPRILEFYEDGKKFDDSSAIVSEDSSQGDSRETQKEIERVIGMSHDMFCQIVAINTYTQPFLFQKVAEQRVIIEQLLGITMLSEKADHLKEETKIVKDALIKEEARIKASEAANKRIQSQIDSLMLKQKAWITQKNDDLLKLSDKISLLTVIDIENELKLHTLWENFRKIEQEKSALKQQNTQLCNSLSKEEKILEHIENDLISLNEQCCQTCKQPLKTEIHNMLVNESAVKKLSSIYEIKIITEHIDAVQEKLKKIPLLEEPKKTFYASLNEVHDHKNKLMLVQQEYQQRFKEIDPYQNQIDSMKNSALEEINMQNINELTHVIDHQEFLYKLLTNKDSFIRKKIIEQNLTYLNARLNYYLTQLNLPHEVIFQNDLSVTITELGRDLSSGNLSRGEMARVSLGLSFAFRDVWEALYQKINILLMDEAIDAGIDSNGTESAVKLLRDMGREHYKDVWVISHKEELISKCTNICRVIKENGFTTFEFE
jgi:DNA repair exonuclease SbcCD ATPase subunit